MCRARQISEWTGLDLDVLTRFQRASGLPHVEDPDAAVFMRPDGDTAVHIKRFIDHGIDPDMMLTIVVFWPKAFRTPPRSCAPPRCRP